jgi:DNA-binding response OmpR family regulator
MVRDRIEAEQREETPMTQRVLIVDDEPNIVVSLEYLMKKEGYEVAVATDGEAALAQLKAYRPHLVLLDIMMPRKSGYEVCEAARADPDLAGIRIVMLTAKGRDFEVAKGMALGADAYVTKPFSTKDLVTLVKALLDGR